MSVEVNIFRAGCVISNNYPINELQMRKGFHTWELLKLVGGQ